MRIENMVSVLSANTFFSSNDWLWPGGVIASAKSQHCMPVNHNTKHSRRWSKPKQNAIDAVYTAKRKVVYRYSKVCTIINPALVLTFRRVCSVKGKPASAPRTTHHLSNRPARLHTVKMWPIKFNPLIAAVALCPIP